MALPPPAFLRALLATIVALTVGCGPQGVAPVPTPPSPGGVVTAETGALPPEAATATAPDSGPHWNRASPDPDRIVLTWSGDPATTQSVTWRTDTTVTAARAEVARAQDGPRLEDSVRVVVALSETLDVRHVDRAGVKVNYHSATFTGLEPGTLYAYRVGDGEHWSEWFQFRTASREAEPFSFLYFGDAQTDILSSWSRTVRAAFAQAPRARFMIHTGDLVNRGHSDREWGEWFRAAGFNLAMIPSLPAPGNHEYTGYRTLEGEAVERPLSVFWRSQFTLPENGAPGVTPESDYYLDYQRVRVVVLNSSEDQEAQARWLDQVLTESRASWTVVAHHHPLFSSAGERDNPALREVWKPVYDRHHVDLVLQGHDHTYARGRTVFAQPDPTAGPSSWDGEVGTVYVNSVSGAKMYAFKTGEWGSYEARLDRSGENLQLFQVVEVDGSTLRFRAYTATGDLFDAFDLVKGEGRPNRLVDRSQNLQ